MSHRIKYFLVEGEKELMKVPKPSVSERTWFRFRVRKDFPTSADKLRLKIKGDAWEKSRSKKNE